jgi:hypothetical protein
VDLGETIFSYTRRQAIGDGVLVDVTATARTCGFRYPVALTSAAWDECVRVPEGAVGQDEAGRLWDVLWVLLCAIRKSRDTGPVMRFAVAVRDASGLRKVRLRSVCGPGDDAEPVITVMLPDED